MNKEGINKKSKLIIIGGARGTDSFLVSNSFYTRLKDFEILYTGKMLNDIAHRFSINSLDDASLMNYYKFIEPSMIDKIITYLSMKNLIIETHYHYTTPGITTNALRQLGQKASKIALVLVESNPRVIYEKNLTNKIKWYKNIKNIEQDIISNKDYFYIYNNILNKITDVKKFRICPTLKNMNKQVNLAIKFLGD